LAIFVRVELTVAAEIPVAFAISEAVIGLRPLSVSRILALFSPRGVRAGAFVALVVGGLAGSVGLAAGWMPAAEPRNDGTLKVHRHVAQALELNRKPLVLTELIFDLLQPLLDLLDNHVEVPTSWHLAPALDCAGS
jgi:hypothetical protein